MSSDHIHTHALLLNKTSTNHYACDKMPSDDQVI